MDFLISIFKAIVGYIVLLFVGTNLLGLIVRGFIPTYKKDSDGSLISVVPINTVPSITMSITFSIIGILYFYALYHFWNIGILIAGLILMFTRLPDLLFEMKTGEKINLRNMAKGPLDIFFTVLSWLTLPLLWYSFYYLG
jgi:hypothetical protein